MPKVVRRKSDGEIIYISEPEFPDGKGIQNALKIKGGQPNDYEEVVVTDSEVQADFDKKKNKKPDIDKLSPLLQAIVNVNWKWHTGALSVPQNNNQLDQQIKDEYQ